MVLFLRNLPNMELVNAVHHGGTLHDITLLNSKGEKENEWCSNHGLCDTKTGSVCMTCTTAAHIFSITIFTTLHCKAFAHVMQCSTVQQPPFLLLCGLLGTAKLHPEARGADF